MSYLISLGVGFSVGLFYWCVKVQSPAPPLIALAGLLGMVLGEHAIPVVKTAIFATQSDAGTELSAKSSATALGRRPADGKDAG